MSVLSWCPKCGRDLDEQDYIDGCCPGCGEPLERTDEEDSPASDEARMADAQKPDDGSTLSTAAAPLSASDMVRPLVLRHLTTGSEVRCTHDGTTLGRSCTPCLSDKPYVGRQHVRITYRDGMYYANDLGSVNGTRLNGRALTGEEAILKHGDVLELDIEEFMVRL